MTDPIVLASGSPRRHHLLDMLGVEHEVRPVSVPETHRPGESPEAYASRLARDKARAGTKTHPGRWVLAADTIVVLGGEILEKPVDADDAVAMLTRLAGREHHVVTACAFARDSEMLEALDRTAVWFRHVPESTVRAYVATGEPLDKAGAYGIQGPGAILVERLEGDYFGVMGLPLVKVAALFERAGRPYAFTR